MSSETSSSHLHQKECRPSPPLQKTETAPQQSLLWLHEPRLLGDAGPLSTPNLTWISPLDFTSKGTNVKTVYSLQNSKS